MSRFDISARWPGFGLPTAAASCLACSTVSGDLSVPAPSAGDSRPFAFVAITLLSGASVGGQSLIAALAGPKLEALGP